METQPITAIPSDFEIKPLYQNLEVAREYRGSAGINKGPATLQYKCVATAPAVKTGQQRADRDGKLSIIPDLSVRENYRVDAVIDRIAILIDTSTVTSKKALRTAIKKQTGVTTYVKDLTIDEGSKDWGEPLPRLNLHHTTGQHFAIMIQEPTPEMLKRIVTAIRATYGINGDVGVHMIEVAVDFYPKDHTQSEGRALLREKIVGFLQRHHWVPHSQLPPGAANVMRDIDARQIFGEESNVSYLFSATGAHKLRSDSEIKQPAIRERVLTDVRGQEIYLNSTLVKGGKVSSHHVSIQHKIANRRNSQRGTKEVLPEEKRRARVEVTLSGARTLQAVGLRTIEDLQSVSFRKLCKPYLTFRQAHIDPLQELLDDAKVQMQTRGVYGIVLRTRARALAIKEQNSRAGRSQKRHRDRETLGLEDWQEMNQVVGQALDALHRHWRVFSTT